jgi:hypothetical protein
MISRNDVIRLLAMAAGGDQRTVGDDDADFWHAVAIQERWTFPAARRAVIEHYSRGADRPRITPAAVTDRIRDLRRRAAESFELPRIPDNQPPHEYPAWLRGQQARHIDALLHNWATTGQEPPAQPHIAAAVVRSVEELAAQAPPHVQRAITDGAARIDRRRTA